MSFALRGLGYWLGLVGVWAAVGAGLSTNAAAAAPALTVPVALVSLANDPRYTPRRLERAYPGHPTGRILDAAQMAVNDTALELQESGITLVLREFSVADAAELPKTLAALKAAGVHHLVADLPAGLLEPLAPYIAIAVENALIHDRLEELNKALSVEKRRLERATLKISHLANHDSLTGLPNRRLLFELANKALETARRAGSILGILFMDMDDFKPINDNFGHAVGDDLLRQVARRLHGAVRARPLHAAVPPDL